MEALVNVSENLSLIADSLGPSVVRVEARPRLASSGIVWSSDGVVVTADHTVEHDNGITLGLADGGSVGAGVVGRDPTTDIAVLRAHATGLTPPRWADIDAARVGHIVLALGRPGRSLRARWGIVGALGRGWQSPAGGQIDHYLEPDINGARGFSGGALADARGAVLGLNTAGLLRHTVVTVPASTLRRVVDTLLTHGRIRRGYLGTGTHPVRLPAALQPEMGQQTGLLVISVEPATPAEQAGLLLGDVLLSLDGRPLQAIDDLRGSLGGDQIGRQVRVRLLRAGRTEELSVVVGERGQRSA